MPAQLTGAIGEEHAARMLRAKGHTIIARNVHSRYGEVDIISECGKFLVFSEVKTRASHAKILPREAVDTRKQGKILKTALLYIAEHRTALQPRFDVIEVYLSAGNTSEPIFQHFENAFGAEGYF